MPPKTPRSPEAGLRGTDGEQVKHQMAELYEMNKKEARKLGEIKDEITKHRN